MEKAPIQLRQDPQYDRFLHAPVGEDMRGSSVTVLSMLARMGLDPWGEACELDAMPEGSARRRLDALMARFSDVPSLTVARGEVVSRLLAFLPQRNVVNQGTPGASSAKLSMPVVGQQLYWVVAVALLLGYLAMRATGS